LRNIYKFIENQTEIATRQQTKPRRGVHADKATPALTNSSETESNAVLSDHQDPIAHTLDLCFRQTEMRVQANTAVSLK
jgi:hypothetical protein